MRWLALPLVALVIAGCGQATRSADQIELSNKVARAQRVVEGYCVDGQGNAPAAVATLTSLAREHPGDDMKRVLADAANAIDCDPTLARELDRVRESL